MTADGARDTRRCHTAISDRQAIAFDDGTLDTRRCHTAIINRQATSFGPIFGPMAVRPSLPIRKNGRFWNGDWPATRVRNETLRAMGHDGRAF